MFTRRLVTRLRVSQEPIAAGWCARQRIRSQWTAMTRKLSSHQTTRKVSDALREQDESKSKDPTEQPKQIEDILEVASTVRRHQLLGPETATPRHWVTHARPDKKHPHWKT